MQLKIPSHYIHYYAHSSPGRTILLQQDLLKILLNWDRLVHQWQITIDIVVAYTQNQSIKQGVLSCITHSKLCYGTISNGQTYGSDTKLEC